MTRFTVNGQPVHYRMDPATPLLWALAGRLQPHRHQVRLRHRPLRRLHRPCRRQCGAQLPRRRSAALEGSFVTTIEGLSRDRSHPIQQAFAADMVPQCGYCIPGVIMAAAALIDRNDSPTDAQIDAAITNHLPLRHLSAPARIDPPRGADQDRARAGRRGAAARHRARGRGPRSAGDPRARAERPNARGSPPGR